MNTSSEKFELQEQLEKFVGDSDLRDKINEELKVDSLLKQHGLEAIKNVSLQQLIDSHNFDDAWASYYLGMMYLHGIKVEQDKEKAIKILKIAADKRHSLAIEKYNELVERKPEIEDLRKDVEILKQAKSHEEFVNYLNNFQAAPDSKNKTKEKK